MKPLPSSAHRPVPFPFPTGKPALCNRASGRLISYPHTPSVVALLVLWFGVSACGSIHIGNTPTDAGSGTDAGDVPSILQEGCGNGGDDDGDGQIDEGCPCGVGERQGCFSQSSLSRGVGLCADGLQQCDARFEFGYWGQCEGEEGPSAEACDGHQDEDCDGAVDETCSCEGGQMRPCAELYDAFGGACHSGIQRCDGGSWGACQDAIGPQPEACGDGIDNDCDGKADEGCDCQPVAEACGDGIDNDCDGVVDEPSCFDGACQPTLAEEGVVPTDPTIAGMLEGLGPRSGLLLPMANVDPGPIDFNDSHLGPPARDYSNAMVFVPEPLSALYTGSSTNTYLANDVWEYSLGANAWRVRFSDGGSMRPYLNAHRAIARWFVRGETPTADEMTAIATYRTWAATNVVFRDGFLQTSMGGPLFPSHQWEGLTYDIRSRRMIWHYGAHTGDLPADGIAYLLDLDEGTVAAELATDTTGMWSFAPESGTWERYRNAEPPETLDGFRAFGAAATFIPELCATIHYVVTTANVPGIFAMWRHDWASDTWTEILPGGETILDLYRANRAPTRAHQMAYSSRHRKLVAADGHRVFAFDIDTQEWSLLVEDDRVNANTAHTVFGYDARNDVFLLLDRETPDRIMAFSLETESWENVTIQGDAFSPGSHNRPFGYFDPRYNVLVVGNTSSRQMWVFRYE